ncbi:hypothetical protein BDR03DRAFT_666089 [Suillus americanus]|nr:hypothetical protein BDR03DRAFT_666089 [Suillus americanus]
MLLTSTSSHYSLSVVFICSRAVTPGVLQCYLSCNKYSLCCVIDSPVRFSIGVDSQHADEDETMDKTLRHCHRM